MLRRSIEFNDALYVAQRMRAADRREIYATRWADDPADVARDVVNCGAFGWTLGIERPIAVLGALPLWPGVWSVWMFATDEFARIGLPATRFARKVMMPALLSSGAHRIECRSMEGHSEAHAWLKALGGRREAMHRNAGKHGETFYTYAWTKPDVLPQRPEGQ